MIAGANGRYRLISAYVLTGLARHVDLHLDYGWTLVGGPSFGEGMWVQAVLASPTSREP